MSLRVVPIMAQQKQIWLVSMRMQVWSLASLSGLRIWCCHELCCKWWTWLGSCIAVAVAKASSYSSDWTLSLGTSICRGCGPKKQKKQKKKKRRTNLRFPCMSRAHVNGWLFYSWRQKAWRRKRCQAEDQGLRVFGLAEFRASER